MKEYTTCQMIILIPPVWAALIEINAVGWPYISKYSSLMVSFTAK
jgi:hypothetical protein